MRYKKAIHDLTSTITQYDTWMTLAWYDIRLRYRRSVLGPFWITLSMGIMIGTMGFLYGVLFQQDIATFFPHLGIGLIIWSFIGNQLNESCTLFIENGHTIKQVPLRLSFYLYRHMTRNLMIFAHNSVIILVLYIFLPIPYGFVNLLAILGMLLLILNGLWISLVLAVICARFRDIPQIVGSLVQISFFMTPIIWIPSVLQDRAWLAELNPFTHMLHIVRGPLMGQAPSVLNWGVAVGFLIVGWLLALGMLARSRHRVAFWI